MPKFLVAMFIAFICSVTFAATDAVVEVEGYAVQSGSAVGVISSSTAYDTVGASGTITLLSNWVPQKGYNYALVVGTITGTGSDSVALAIVLDCKDASGNVIYSATVDSVTSSVGGAFDLDVGSIAAGAGAIGHKFDVKLTAYTGAGTEAKLTRLYIYRSRPMNISRDWMVGR